MEARDFENFQKSLKNVKIPKMSKIVPKSVQKCLEHVSGQIFAKNFFAHCSMEARDFEKFQKKSKKFQNSKKNPKSFPNISKRVLNVFWGKFLEKILGPVFHGGSILRIFSKKIKKISKF